MMRRNFKFYFIIWAIAFAMFNVLSFVPKENIERLQGGGWVGYGFIIAAFLAQLGCSFYSLGASTANKMFYRISLVDTSYFALATMWAVGMLCMAINPSYIWIAAIVCMIVLAFNAIAIIKTLTATSYVERVDEQVKTQTWFIKSLTVNAEGMIDRARSPEIKAEAQKIYEAARYSDPMSAEALSGIEGQISLRFTAFADAVAANNVSEAQRISNEIIILIGDRNKTCKLLK